MTKEKILAELRFGKTPREISKKCDTPYVTILSWSKTMKKAIEKEALVDTVTEVSPTVLSSVITELKERAPTEELKNELTKVANGIDGAKMMSDSFQSAIGKVIKWAEKHLDNEDLSLKDWGTISATLTTMYTAVFSKNVTNINMVNGDVTNATSIFKARMGA